MFNLSILVVSANWLPFIDFVHELCISAEMAFCACFEYIRALNIALSIGGQVYS